MDTAAVGQGELIDWGVAARALAGEARSGDSYVVEPFPGGVLVAAVDGLGHGDEAADAARAATDILSQHPDEPPVSLVRRCHEGLRATRGVAMSLASFGRMTHTMSWLAVGNVEGLLFKRDTEWRTVRESLLLRGGVVGYRLPTLLPSVVSVGAGDVLVFATDGIRTGSFDGLRMTNPPAKIAEDIVARFSRGTDDALALVARYRGERS
ncbi:MAG: SpoIIE family protein phosphatase [Actinomycetota bacterium]